MTSVNDASCDSRPVNFASLSGAIIRRLAGMRALGCLTDNVAATTTVGDREDEILQRIQTRVQKVFYCAYIYECADLVIAHPQFLYHTNPQVIRSTHMQTF